jgi:RNA polymerase sigma-70 factor (ECF subfamily)
VENAPSSSAADSQAALVAAMRRGDAEAAETLVRHHAGPLRAVVRRILGNDHDVDDALQDAFLSAFRAIDRFDGKARIGTWLHRIAVNAALMRLRARRRRPEQTIDPLLPQFQADGHRLGSRPAWTPPDEARLQAAETRRVIQRSLDRLPDDYRTVIVLRDIEELDTRQTADLLELSEAAVKTRLHRARQALRTLLEKELS